MWPFVHSGSRWIAVGPESSGDYLRGTGAVCSGGCAASPGRIVAVSDDVGSARVLEGSWGATTLGVVGSRARACGLPR